MVILIETNDQPAGCEWLSKRVRMEIMQGRTVGIFARAVWPEVVDPAVRWMEYGDVNFYDAPAELTGVKADEYIFIEGVIGAKAPEGRINAAIKHVPVVGVERPFTRGVDARAAARRAHRAQQVALGFNWNGVVFQTRPQDLSLIAGRATKIAAKKALGETVADFYWRAEDNTDHLFTGDEFLRFAVAVDEFVESKYIESWTA